MKGASYASYSYVKCLEVSVLAEIAVASHKKKSQTKRVPRKRTGLTQESAGAESNSGLQQQSSSNFTTLKEGSVTGGLTTQSGVEGLWTQSMELEYQKNKPLKKKVLVRNKTKHNVVSQLMNMKVALGVWKE